MLIAMFGIVGTSFNDLEYPIFVAPLNSQDFLVLTLRLVLIVSKFQNYTSYFET